MGTRITRLLQLESRAILTAVTLGLDSARSGIYADVAQGHHELPSLHSFLLMITAVLILVLWSMIMALIGLRLIPRILEDPTEVQPAQQYQLHTPAISINY